MKKSKYLKNIFFIIIIDIIVLLLTEVSLRAIFKDGNFINTARNHFDPITHIQPCDTKSYKLDSVVFWKFKPSLEHSLKDETTGEFYSFHINKYGFRGDNYSLEIKNNEFRILTLGASSAVGWHVAQTYTSILKNLLSEEYPDRDIIAINAGVDGYTSYQGLEFLEKNIDFLKPDLLLVHFGHNDWSDALLNIEDKRLNYSNLLSFRYKKILKKSYLFLTLYNMVVRLKDKIKSDLISPRIRVRVSIEDYKKNLLGMYLLAKDFNTPVIFINSSVTLPAKDIKTGLNVEYIFSLSEKYAVSMKEVVDSFENTYLIDTVFLAKEMGNSEFYADHKNGDLWHPGKLGHYAIAKEIFKITIKNDLLI